MAVNQSMNTAIVIGANGGIGKAITQAFIADPTINNVVAITRNTDLDLSGPLLNKNDFLNGANTDAQTSFRHICASSDEADIAGIVTSLTAEGIHPRYVVIATGMLHDKAQNIVPEKRLNQLNAHNLEKLLETNTVLPITWLKQLSLLLNRHTPTTIAVLSARVGSIEDNRLGGWYSYRASKAALNMLLKTTAIEFKLRFPQTKLIAFHPGTTDTELSKPFQKNVPDDKLFTPEFVATQLHTLMQSAHADGRCDFIDWNHKPVSW